MSEHDSTVGVRLAFKDRAKFARDAAETSHDIAKIGDAGQKVHKNLQIASTALGILTAKVGLELFRFGRESVQDFRKAEVSQNELADAFEKFPALADVNINSIRALAKERQKLTKFDDDETVSGAAVLAQFDLTGRQVKQLIPLLQDYAVKIGSDLPTAAGDLGRAFLGNARALKTIGIDFKATGDRAKDYNTIMQALRDKVGGFAESEGRTGSGRLAILANQFGDLREKLGEQLIPVINKLIRVFLTVTVWMERNQTIVKPLVWILGTLTAVVIGTTLAIKAWEEAQVAALAIRTLFIGSIVEETGARSTGLIAIALNILGYTALGVLIVANTALTLAVAAANLVWAAATGDMTLAQWALNIAMDANPIGLVILGITALIGLGYLIYRNWTSIKELFSGFWDGLVSGFRAALNFIIRGWNGLTGSAGHFGIHITPIPELASGGIVKATPGGTIVRLGEGQYDEQVTPIRTSSSSGTPPVMSLGSFGSSSTPNISPLHGGSPASQAGASPSVVFEAGAIIVYESGDPERTRRAVAEGVLDRVARG